MLFRRRTILAIGAFSALAGTLASARISAAGAGEQPDADQLAEDFATLKASVRADYLAGRVVVHNGWIMSEHEALAVVAGR